MDRFFFFFFSLIGTYDFLFNFIVVSSHLTTGTVGEISEEISSTNLLEPEPHHHSVIRHRTSRPTGYRKWPTLNPLDPPRICELAYPKYHSAIYCSRLHYSHLWCALLRSRYVCRSRAGTRDTSDPDPCLTPARARRSSRVFLGISSDILRKTYRLLFFPLLVYLGSERV